MKLFSAEWCTPCKNLKKIIEEEGLLPPDAIKDIQENFEEAQSLMIRSVPSLVVSEDRILTKVDEILEVLRGMK